MIISFIALILTYFSFVKRNITMFRHKTKVVRFLKYNCVYLHANILLRSWLLIFTLWMVTSCFVSKNCSMQKNSVILHCNRRKFRYQLLHSYLMNYLLFPLLSIYFCERLKYHILPHLGRIHVISTNKRFILYPR